MNSFFHAYTKKYAVRCRYATWLTAAPLAEICTMSVWTVLFNLRRVKTGDFLLPLAALVGVCIITGMLLCWLYRELAQKAIARASRYTFFDICGKHAVYSRYSGEYSHLGEKIIMRTLYVLPLKAFGMAYLDTKKKHLILTGEIRVYYDRSDKLGYHIIDGALEFDGWWYNDDGFKTIGMLRLPTDFEHPALVAKALYEAKAAYDAIPAKKPYVFREADIVKKRKELKKIAENIRYQRKW